MIAQRPQPDLELPPPRVTRLETAVFTPKRRKN
jgi:hypothetical protein